MQDVAQIGFFFLQRKNPIYSSFQREIPCCRLGKSSTPPVLITHSIFFSFPPLLLRLRELDFIGCYETVDQQTAEPPKTLWICEYVNMWICKHAHVAHWVKHKGLPWKWTFALSIFKMPGLVLNKDKLTLLKCLFFCIVWIVWADFGKLSCLALYIILSNIYLWVTPN